MSNRGARRKACGGKASHPDLDTARAHAQSLKARGGDARPFLCRWCHRWHLGHPGREL